VELFAIVLSVPVAVVMSMGYCAILAKVVRKLDGVRRPLYSASLVLLGLFLVELVLLVMLGAVRSRAIVGPGFYVAHVVFFFLGTPALANALILGGRGSLVSRWCVAGAICTIFAVMLVLLQYHVSEALYGLNGTDGPYSPTRTNSHKLFPQGGTEDYPERTRLESAVAGAVRRPCDGFSRESLCEAFLLFALVSMTLAEQRRGQSCLID
jgi:hypothetical protein